MDFLDKDIATLQIRSQVNTAMRNFFTNHSFVEVETPLLVASPGTEPYLDVFSTQLEVASGQTTTGYLTTSPEFAMKKILAAGLPMIFQICKSFRNNEGIGPHHNHEFTILEWYRADADYLQAMEDCENLVRATVAATNLDSNEFSYQGQVIELQEPFLRFTVSELFEKYVGITPDELVDEKTLIGQATKRDVGTVTSWDDAFTLLFAHYIEPKLAEYQQPVFVYRYPLQQAALAKKCADDSRFVERFELYIAGIELANAFSELTDPQEQRQRCEADIQLRATLDKQTYPLDDDFFESLAMINTATGVALGVDRLVMLCADAAALSDVTWFTTQELFQIK